MKGKLYLVPTTLGESELNSVLPASLPSLLKNIKFYIVENVRTVRRFLVKAGQKGILDQIEFFVLNKHTQASEISSFLLPIDKGQDIAIISEAGCPGVADPGADVVALAHSKNIAVVPVTGPSSIIMAVMASGLNGQSFAFNGYLPIKKPEKIKRIKFLENRSKTEGQTQVFIEAPYRNLQLLEDLIAACNPKTRLCIACDITLNNEYIKTQTIAQWKKTKPQIQKRPAVFLIQA